MNLPCVRHSNVMRTLIVGLFVASPWGAVDANLILKPSSWTVVVSTGDAVRIDATASVDLTTMDGLAEPDFSMLRLVEISEGKERFVPSQIDLSSPARLWWIVDGTSRPGSKRTYRLDASPTDKDKPPVGTGVVIERNPDFVEFRIGTSRVLRYNSAHIAVTEAVDPRYARSAYIHPAWTPKGTVVTDQFPPDHAHQSGIFLANVKTEFEGRTPDFWNLLGETGRVRFKQIKSLVQGPVFGDLLVEHEHVDLSAPDSKVALLETWKVRVWNQNNPAPDFRVFDITSQVTCASSSPLRLKEYHYGGMALRGAREWTPAHCRFVTSEGKDRLAGNHSRPRWCDLNGNVNGSLAGITFMTHAGNYGYPEPLRIHPKMPYMVYSPAVLGDRDLVPGQPIVASYRFLVHDGEIAQATADRLASDFSTPLIGSVVIPGGGDR